MKYAALAAALGLSALTAFAPARAEQPFLVALSEDDSRAPADILEAAAETGQFERFIAAAEAAGLDAMLRGDGPYTVFAPTDAAFATMDERAWRRLLAPEQRAELRALISAHVVGGRVGGGDSVTRVRTLSGGDLSVDTRDGVRVNNQLAAVPDVEAGNGVIHGVNTVLTAQPMQVAAR